MPPDTMTMVLASLLLASGPKAWSTAPSKRSLSSMCRRKASCSDLSSVLPSASIFRSLSADAAWASPEIRPVHRGPYINVSDRWRTRSLHLRYHRCDASLMSPVAPTTWATSACRHFSSTNTADQQSEERGEGAPSNRAAFRSTPVIPSILAHIEKIGVGIRSKKRRRRRGSAKRASRNDGNTLDEAEELEYFNENERRHRLRRHVGRIESITTRVRDAAKKSAGSVANDGKKEASERDKGAHWLPPPPFSSFARNGNDDRARDDSAPGRSIVRRPVKFLGKAGSLSGDLPRQTKGLPEVAFAGRSNVGKSTLLNALLYGNIDPELSQRKFQRDRAKLPKGVKAVASSKPGETKELSFYQLTTDVITTITVQQQQCGDGGLEISVSEDNTKKETEKISLLMVDLPGYGFAFAKTDRQNEWLDLMHHYLLERRSLKRILLLLDARHGFKKADFDFLGELQDGLIAKKEKRELPPIQIVLTKCDLVKQPDLARRVVIVRRQLSDFLVREPSSLPVMLVSALPGLGFNVRGDVPLGGVLELQRELASLVPLPRAHGARN